MTRKADGIRLRWCKSSRPLTGAVFFCPFLAQTITIYRPFAGLIFCYYTFIGGRGDLAARLSRRKAFRALLFGGIRMQEFERLIAAGMSADTAWETAYWFHNYATEGDFERYILEFQRGQRGRPVDG